MSNAAYSPARLLRAAGRRAKLALGPGFRIAADFIFQPVARRARRNSRRWVFGHERGEFAGNPKFLYLWLLGREDIEPYWITGNWRVWRKLRRQGWPASLRWSPWGIGRTLTAGAVFYGHRTSDVNAALVRGALLVNLWHGVGLKAISLGWDRGRTARLRSAEPSRLDWAKNRTYLTDPDLVVTTSSFMQKHFSDQFRLNVERCPILGYPRLDVASEPELALRSRQFDEPRQFALRPPGVTEVHVYMPTSRDSNKPLLREAIPDFARLEGLLAARNAIFYIKLHPQTFERIPAEFEHVRKWPDGVDIYNYLGDLDALITDYSSVLYDYVALRGGAGAIIYAYDLEEYLSRDRTLLYPFKDNIAGTLVRDFDRLCEHLAAGIGSMSADPAQAEAIRAKFWGSSARTASTRIYDYVRSTLGLAQHVPIQEPSSGPQASIAPAASSMADA